MLALAVDMDTPLSDWTFEAPDASAALLARPAYRAYLRARADGERSDLAGAELIYAELVANVVRHAPGPIRIIVAWQQDGRATLCVRDSGSGYNPAAAISRDELAESGRGLIIVASIAKRMFVSRFDDGAAVTAVLPVVRAPIVLGTSTAMSEHRMEHADHKVAKPLDEIPASQGGTAGVPIE